MAILFFWCLVAAVIVLPVRYTVYALFVSLSFTTFAILPVDLLGGITLVPMIVFAPLTATRLFLSSLPATLQDAVLNWRHLGLLTAFVANAALVTILAPRLFAGADTIGLNTSALAGLAPTAGNITQMVYLVSSYCVVVAIYLLLLQKGGRAILATALLLGGMAAVLTGALDMATTGSDVLAPLRTATYAIMTEADMGGVRRVVGLQPEASAYGSLTLSLAAMLLFMRPTAPAAGGWRVLSGLTGTGCVAMAALSTSSSAMVGGIVLLGIIVFDTIMLALGGRYGAGQQRLRTNVVILTILLIGVGLTITLLPATAERLYDIFDSAVLHKSASSSFEERSAWNATSLSGLAATGGFGVGVGSTRASSWIVAVLCGTGVIGSVLLLSFIARAMLEPVGAGASPADRELLSGSRRALLVALLPAMTAATSVDFGVLVAVLFATMTAIPATVEHQRVRTLAPRRAPPHGPAGSAEPRSAEG